MPFDLEMAMCSGSVDRGISVEEPLDVAYARDAAHGGYQLFELFLVPYVDRHLDDAAIVIGLADRKSTRLNSSPFPYATLFRSATSRTPEMRRMAATSFSSCFLSRTSTVISTMPPS